MGQRPLRRGPQQRGHGAARGTSVREDVHGEDRRGVPVSSPYGEGDHVHIDENGVAWEYIDQDCEDCGGAGHVWDRLLDGYKDCGNCRATGKDDPMRVRLG